MRTVRVPGIGTSTKEALEKGAVSGITSELCQRNLHSTIETQMPVYMAEFERILLTIPPDTLRELAPDSFDAYITGREIGQLAVVRKLGS